MRAAERGPMTGGDKRTSQSCLSKTESEFTAEADKISWGTIVCPTEI